MEIIKDFEKREKENAELYKNIPKIVRNIGINESGVSAYANKRGLLKNEEQAQKNLEKTLKDEVAKAKKESDYSSPSSLSSSL